MVSSLTYRTNDVLRWGTGQGSDLSAVTIDLNFWTLFSAISTLESEQSAGAGIDFITQPTGGNIFFIHLTDHRVLGPFTIPTAQWNPRGAWAALTAYALYDTVSFDGSLYLIITPHTSGASFSPFATDGLGHNLYALLLEQPQDEIPLGGTPRQRLVKAAGSPFHTAWETDWIRLALFVSGQPLGGETLLQYVCVDTMTLPAGLVGSAFFSHTATGTSVTYTLSVNGSPVGTITFAPSPELTVSMPSDILCEPGDVITLIAPSVPDSAQANISFTIVAELV